MKLQWKAVMKDGTIHRQAQTHWRHIHQIDMARLEIVDEFDKPRFTLPILEKWFLSPADEPVERRYRNVTDGMGNLHVIKHPDGVVIVSERDGSVRQQAEHGGEHGWGFSQEGRDEWLTANPRPPRKV
jgi:hypothetical protein